MLASEICCHRALGARMFMVQGPISACRFIAFENKRARQLNMQNHGEKPIADLRACRRTMSLKASSCSVSGYVCRGEAPDGVRAARWLLADLQHQNVAATKSACARKYQS